MIYSKATDEELGIRSRHTYGNYDIYWRARQAALLAKETPEEYAARIAREEKAAAGVARAKRFAKKHPIIYGIYAELTGGTQRHDAVNSPW